MNFRVLVVIFALMGAANAMADLKPDVLGCDPKKAARNAAMGATVGVSGKCDAGKAAKNAKEDVADNVKDSVDLDGSKRKLGDHKDKQLIKKNKD